MSSNLGGDYPSPLPSPEETDGIDLTNLGLKGVQGRLFDMPASANNSSSTEAADNLNNSLPKQWKDIFADLETDSTTDPELRNKYNSLGEVVLRSLDEEKNRIHQANETLASGRPDPLAPFDEHQRFLEEVIKLHGSAEELIRIRSQLQELFSPYEDID